MWMFKTYPKCFVGYEAVTWLSEYLDLDRGDAVRVGQSMVDSHLFHHTCFDHGKGCKQPFLWRLGSEARQVVESICMFNDCILPGQRVEFRDKKLFYRFQKEYNWKLHSDSCEVRKWPPLPEFNRQDLIDGKEQTLLFVLTMLESTTHGIGKDMAKHKKAAFSGTEGIDWMESRLDCSRPFALKAGIVWFY